MKRFGFVVMMGAVLAALFIAGCTSSSMNEKSVSLGGYNFTADLPEGWDTFKDLNIEEADDEDAGIHDGYSWKGVATIPWFYPQYPNAPKDDSYYTGSALTELYVLTIPSDLKQDQLDENIRIYGSVDKIPDDKKEKDIKTMLTDVAPPYNSKLIMDYSDEDITFNDFPAHLAEMEAFRNAKLNSEETNSYGRVAILLDENTVGIIDVTVMRYSPSGQFFDGKASDVIDSFRITKE